MSISADPEAQEVLDQFAEAMFRLIVARYQRHLAELGLTMVQAQVLRLLHMRKSASTGEIAAELGISAPAVTQLTDRLIRKHLIERRTAAEDRRSVLVALSGRGKRAMEHFRERRGDIFKDALDRLGGTDRRSALETMGKMLSVLEPSGSETALYGAAASKLIETKKGAARGK